MSSTSGSDDRGARRSLLSGGGGGRGGHGRPSIRRTRRCTRQRRRLRCEKSVAGYKSEFDSGKTSRITLNGKRHRTISLLYLYSQWIFVVSLSILPVSKNFRRQTHTVFRQRISKRFFNRSNRRTKVKHTLVVFYTNRRRMTVLQFLGN